MSRLGQIIDGCAVRYECEDLDAGLPMHSHIPNSGMEHDVHCLAGALLVWMHPEGHLILRAGDRATPDTTRWHGIVPLEAGTVFVNTSSIDNGQSRTVLDSPHKAPDWVLAIREKELS